MTIKAIAIAIAITLTATVSAKASRIDNFCGDRYCGHVEQPLKQAHKTHYKIRQIATHKKIQKKAVQVASLGETTIGESPKPSISLLLIAKGYLGSNPTGWNSLWCARFIAMIAPTAANALKRMGLNPNWARDYAKLPGAHNKGLIGDIVVLTRGNGGHIGILAGYRNGNPIIVSGNHGHLVGIGVYPARRVIAYVSIT